MASRRAVSERDRTPVAKVALRLAEVRKVFGTLEAIKSISVEVPDGEFISLLGPSGCGKSTLLMMIAGLTQPTSGELVLAGSPITGPRNDVGVVFQSPVLLPWRSVIDNVLFPIELLRLPRAQYLDRAMGLLKMTKLEDFADALPRQLSGGMRQRASICRALIHDPNTLLMDEPFSALDAITRDDMAVELLRIWQANRKTVIFVTHSIREAAFLSDRVLVMGRRPATIIDEVRIDLPRTRQIGITEEEGFNKYVRHLRKSIEASHVS
ncbi:MAG TPA: ABC transporter ATP-binding protein [Pseudolabrys sp.]|nr:ABC transporter ATP-binding protein [Pseudolabrys sp.]